jgi:hypothetical protein
VGIPVRVIRRFPDATGSAEFFDLEYVHKIFFDFGGVFTLSTVFSFEGRALKIGALTTAQKVQGIGLSLQQSLKIRACARL